MLNTEWLNKSNLNLSEEEENKEIKFITISPEFTIISVKKMNLSSKDFFEKFFRPKKNSKDDFSYIKFYKSLVEHYNINTSDFINLNSEKEDEIIIEKAINFNLKLKGIPFCKWKLSYFKTKINNKWKKLIYILFNLFLKVKEKFFQIF